MLKQRIANFLLAVLIAIFVGLCDRILPDGPARWIAPLAIVIVAVLIILWINIRRYRRDR